MGCVEPARISSQTLGVDIYCVTCALGGALKVTYWSVTAMHWKAYQSFCCLSYEMTQKFL